VFVTIDSDKNDFISVEAFNSFMEKYKESVSNIQYDGFLAKLVQNGGFDL